MSQANYQDAFKTLKDFKITDTKKGKFFSLPALEKNLGVKVSRLPISIRIVLESDERKGTVIGIY